MMRYLWCADAQGAAEAAAELLARQVRARPASVMGMPTGESVRPMYDRLAALSGAGIVSFAEASTFNLDEYVGLGPGNPASYHVYMARHFIDRVGIPPERAHLPDGDAPDPGAACRAYEAAVIEAGGLDVAVLGLGRNGHIGFNEPGSSPHSRTRVVDLSAETRAQNGPRFANPSAVPARAITVGIGTILEARSILLIAAGAGKEAALAALAAGSVDPAWPVTQLWRHGDVTVVADVALRRGP